jgi:hypothetical protein
MASAPVQLIVGIEGELGVEIGGFYILEVLFLGLFWESHIGLVSAPDQR